MKRILITAGTVYGPLDANKLVGNRVRGLWAAHLARHLTDLGYPVTLLVPDTQQRSALSLYTGESPNLTVVEQHGFNDYRDKCKAMAAGHDVAIMAAAVVNWIPAEPYPGKMPTKGYKAGDIIQVPFVLAPHVIDEMKVANPKLTLIGCKMLVNAPEDDLIEAAYDVLLRARCNAVVANDMGRGLKRKLIVNKDRTVQEYDNDFEGFYDNLIGHIEDVHYQTDGTLGSSTAPAEARRVFDAVVEKYRHRFVLRQAGSDRVFGAVYVPTFNYSKGLVSPREKGQMFSSVNAVDLDQVLNRTCYVHGPSKATLNAPLLARVAQQYQVHRPVAVLHLHEQIPGAPTVPYAPPGTVRDNEREIPFPIFNIEGHGFIACLKPNLDLWDVP